MRYGQFVYEDFMIDEPGGFSLYIAANDELVKALNKQRQLQGYTDLVGCDYGNDVWYNFYLIIKMADKQIALEGTCNNGKEDDWVVYGLPLNNEDKIEILLSVVEYLADEEREDIVYGK